MLRGSRLFPRRVGAYTPAALALVRDEREERLARIEQMLETLKAEVQRFSEFHQRAVEDARLGRRHVEEARRELNKERRPIQKRRAAAGRKKR
jgi:hypothetical protein